RRVLWGNDGPTLRAVRDPFAVADALRRAGLPGPAVRSSAGGLPRDGSWLVKPRNSAGGAGGERWWPEPPQRRRRPCYYQEYVSGLSLAAVFVGNRTGASLAGVTRQLIGRPGAEFSYRGSIGPWPLSPLESARIEALGRLLAAT